MVSHEFKAEIDRPNESNGRTVIGLNAESLLH